MTKKKKLYLIFTVVFTIVIVALLLVCGLFYKPKSFKWEGMVFNLPNDFTYTFSKTDNRELLHIFPDNMVDGSRPTLVISRVKLNERTKEDILSKANNDKQVDLLNYGSGILDGEEIFILDVKNRHQGEEQKVIFIFNKNTMMILRHKNRELFKQFDPVLESIRFIDDEKADRK